MLYLRLRDGPGIGSEGSEFSIQGRTPLHSSPHDLLNLAVSEMKSPIRATVEILAKPLQVIKALRPQADCQSL